MKRSRHAPVRRRPPEIAKPVHGRCEAAGDLVVLITDRSGTSVRIDVNAGGIDYLAAPVDGKTPLSGMYSTSATTC